MKTDFKKELRWGMKNKTVEEIVRGGCGHSAEDMEFSAVVVTLSVIGYLAIALIAIAVN